MDQATKDRNEQWHAQELQRLRNATPEELAGEGMQYCAKYLGPNDTLNQAWENFLANAPIEELVEQGATYLANYLDENVSTDLQAIESAETIFKAIKQRNVNTPIEKLAEEGATSLGAYLEDEDDDCDFIASAQDSFEAIKQQSQSA